MLQPDIVLVRLVSGGETNRRINEAAKLSKVSGQYVYLGHYLSLKQKVERANLL
jgi:hypothetical protein